MENLIFEQIEHSVHYDDKNLVNTQIFMTGQLICVMLILATNGYLLQFIMKQPTKTFLDWMMILDTSLCISNIVIVIMIGQRIFCYFIINFGFFINISNRLLTAGIVVYRYVFVMKSNLVQTTFQRKALEILIIVSILVPSSLLTGFAIYYKDYYLQYLSKFNFKNSKMCLYHIVILFYLACVNENYKFYYQKGNFYENTSPGSTAWNLPLYHPFNASTLVCFCGSMFLTPIGYWKIFR